MKHKFFSGRDYPLVERPGDEFWWHSTPLPDGTRTRSRQEIQDVQFLMWEGMQIEERIAGKRVLDVGAADGWFSIAASAAGASSVSAIDKDYLGWPNNVSFLSREWNLPVEILTEDFRSLEAKKFDVILFLGVLYHLEDVFSAIKKLGELLSENGIIIIETQVTSIENRLPIFEAASDVFDGTNDQGVEALDSVGVSNYLLPNPAAMDQLAHMYFFENTHRSECEYTKRQPGRHIFEFRKRPEGAGRWTPPQKEKPVVAEKEDPPQRKSWWSVWKR